MDERDLKNAGLKVTPPRLKILEILERSEHRHMRVDDIYRALIDQNEEVGIATIYRVLMQFEKSGIVHKHSFENQAVYELSNANHHDHIVCIKCGKIDEFYDEMIEKRQREIATEKGYQLTDHCHYLYGLCRDCQ